MSWSDVRDAPAALLAWRSLVVLGRAARRRAASTCAATSTYPFDTIFVNAPSSPPMSTELKRALDAARASAKVVDIARPAPRSRSTCPSVVDDKDVLSLSSGGSVREYQLVKRVSFRLRDKERHRLDARPARS